MAYDGAVLRAATANSKHAMNLRIYFTWTGMSCASSVPLALSKVTTISPSGGVCAASAELTEMATLVSVAPGFTPPAKPPSLIALDHGLYLASPATVLLDRKSVV